MADDRPRRKPSDHKAVVAPNLYRRDKADGTCSFQVVARGVASKTFSRLEDALAHRRELARTGFLSPLGKPIAVDHWQPARERIRVTVLCDDCGAIAAQYMDMADARRFANTILAACDRLPQSIATPVMGGDGAFISTAVQGAR